MHGICIFTVQRIIMSQSACWIIPLWGMTRKVVFTSGLLPGHLDILRMLSKTSKNIEILIICGGSSRAVSYFCVFICVSSTCMLAHMHAMEGNLMFVCIYLCVPEVDFKCHPQSFSIRKDLLPYLGALWVDYSSYSSFASAPWDKKKVPEIAGGFCDCLGFYMGSAERGPSLHPLSRSPLGYSS